MVWMRGEVYEALREIGVSEDKAIKAAVAFYQRNVNDIDPNSRRGRVQSRVGAPETTFDHLQRNLAIMKWMVAIAAALAMIVLIML
jgi:hypothetical protein